MSKLTDAELDLYFVVKGSGGNFKTKLFELICASDICNQELLKRAFPDFVEVVIKYKNEAGYWTQVQERYND